MILLVLAASTALAITPADVAEKPWLSEIDTKGWTMIAMTIKKNRINLYQPVSGPPIENIRLGWVRAECEIACNNPSSPDPSGLILYKFDCAASTERVLLDATYSERNLTGTVSTTHLYDNDGDSEVMPGTVPARAFAIACGPATAG